MQKERLNIKVDKLQQILLCNTNRDISDYIKNHHNYEVAEIIETDLNILNDRYKRWFDNITN